MKILICINDTFDSNGDNNSIKIMKYIKKHIMYNKYGTSFNITKHVLLKNTSPVCMEVDVVEDEYNELIKDSKDIIKENISDISNPGICIVIVDKIINKEELIEFALKAKKEEIRTSDAKVLALKSGIYLKGVTESDNGIAGALVGAILRLNDDGEVYIEEN